MTLATIVPGIEPAPVVVACDTCKHSINFSTQAEADRFLASSGWVDAPGSLGTRVRCCVCANPEGMSAFRSESVPIRSQGPRDPLTYARGPRRVPLS